MSYTSGSGNVHADFLDLQDFQNVLRRSIDQFTEIDSKTKGTLDSYVWNDKVADQFKQDFHIGMEPINALRSEMEGFIPYLQVKINALMQYIGA